MIDLSLVAGRLNIRITWGQKTTTPSAPQNAGYPMRVGGPVGFARRATRPVIHHTEETS